MAVFSHGSSGMTPKGRIIPMRKLRDVLLCAAAVVLAAFVLTGFDTEAAGSVAASSAVIQGSNVVVTVSAPSVPSTDDGLYHLVATDVNGQAAAGTEVAYAAAGKSAQFVFPLNYNTSSSNLYKKFAVTVNQGGVRNVVSNEIYIQNPEALARHTAARRDNGKKGLLPESTLLHSGTLAASGIKQITYNMNVGDVLSGTGMNYTYNGKTYSFSSAAIGQLDDLVPLMNNQGIQVSIILLNNWTGAGAYVHPYSRDNTAQNYYMFNTVDQASVEKLEALASLLGERFSGNGHGTVDNWIVGNEVNARSPWNYMSASMDEAYFTSEYAKSFRIFYNGIRSQNANARIFTCVDQEYAQADSALHYAGQTWLVLFSQTISATGNIDWNVAVHPYDFPLYDPNVWAQTTNYPTKVNHTQSSAYVTMANIDVFTDFMCTPAMRSPSGAVRHIICSEQGYNSTAGEQIQAAAVVYAYLQAVNNRYIDGFVLSREQDHAVEVAQSLAFGIRNVNTTPKLALQWYKTAESTETQAAASAVIGTPITSLLTVR